MNVERARVVVIGGGVVGCSILWELARRGIPGLLLESGSDVCEGSSKANSGIVHTGFDARPDTVEARMLRAARAIWPSLVEELGVPFLSVGAIMLARSDEEERRLQTEIAANAAAMGVEVELLNRRGIRAVAPFIAPNVVAALSVPGEAVIDPFWLTRAFAEAAIAGGAEVRLGAQVVGLDENTDAITIRLADGQAIAAAQVINAAGLRADEIARMGGDDSFAVSPRKGQFLVSEETFGVDRIVLPIPGPAGKGMLVTPIVFGGLLLGPTAVDGHDKDDDAVDPAARKQILAECQAMVPDLSGAIPVRQFAGLRHVSSSGDFIIRPSAASDRLYLVAGIRSTGISTSPAIARTVVDEVVDLRGWQRSGRPLNLAPLPTDLSDQAGEIVCICRSISRAEIESAARRPLRPMTLDSIKRRAGAMFGDCQGNMCAVDVATILAGERGVPISAIEQHRAGSWLWRRRTDQAESASAAVAAESVVPRDWDVVVIGGGSAGRAAARAIGHGLRTLIVERSPGRATTLGATLGDEIRVANGWTVTGVVPGRDGWLVLGQSRQAMVEFSARAVILATGAYVSPPEQRGIAGPRPAGLMTADRAWRSLDAGLAPGAEIVLVGHGRHVESLARELALAGARVRRVDELPLEVRGQARLEAVRTGAGWLAADTLILADVLLAQTFLLRGLGLLDGAPGRLAPVNGAGRLPRAGLWASGCCVRPDPDHAACAIGGAAVGRLAAESLQPTRNASLTRAES